MAELHLIYGLVDPRTREIRYVGQSSTGMKRPLQEHLAHCLKWERMLVRLGLTKEIVILEECPVGSDPAFWLDETETFYIRFFRAMGARLTNIADGGTGGATRRGMKNSPAHREALRASNIGRSPTDETRKKIGAGQCGRKHTPEHNAKIGAGLRGKKQSEAAKTANSESKISYWKSERSLAHREKLRERMRGPRG